MEFWIPYGETEIPIRVPDDNFYKILEPSKPASLTDPALLLRGSLDKPVGGLSLSDAVKPGSTVGIVVDPMVSQSLREAAVEALKSRLESAGVEAVKLFVRKRTSNVSLTLNHWDGARLLDPATGEFTKVGRTRSGTKVSVDQGLLSCETRICVSMTLPHFASGFSGGPEALLPGASSMETVAMNRSLMVQGITSPLDDDGSVALQDSLEACRLVGSLYSLSLVPDGRGGLDSAFSGEMEAVFKEARAKYLQVHSPEIDRHSDIVVISAGSVLGMDLYHGVRTLSNAWQAVKKGGTIILVAECSRGTGDTNFLEYARRFRERRELVSELKRRFKLGGHVSLLLQDALEKYRVQLVSVLPDYYVRNSFRLKPSRTASGAVQQALRVEGKDAKVLIVAHGDLALPRILEPS